MASIDFSRVEGIIFDYGGTLDSGGDHWSIIIRRAYEKAGVYVAEEHFREAYVFAERELARTLHILPHHNFHDLLEIKIRIELERLAAEALLPASLIDTKAPEIAKYCYTSARESIEHARPVLQRLSERFPMVLVSNFYGNIATVLRDFGIDGYFKDVIESAVVGIRKPDPKIFELGARALGLAPDRTLVVGDSYRKDIVPAETIGCQVLWLKGKGWTAEEDAILHPAIISDLHDLLQLLDGAEASKPSGN